MTGYFQAFELDELEKEQQAGSSPITSSCGGAACR